jgi:hypothetical protein
MTKRTQNQRQADAWAPQLALAARYRKTASRHDQKAEEFRELAAALEADVARIREGLEESAA